MNNITIKSEVERLKVELEKVNRFREALRSKLNRKSDQLSEALHHLESVKRHHDEAQAAAAVMREALRELKIRIAYIGMPQEPFWLTDAGQKVWDWRKQIALLENALHNTAAGTAFLARMAEAEDMLRQYRRGIMSLDHDGFNKRCDAFLKGEGVKA